MHAQLCGKNKFDLLDFHILKVSKLACLVKNAFVVLMGTLKSLKYHASSGASIFTDGGLTIPWIQLKWSSQANVTEEIRNSHRVCIKSLFNTVLHY